MKRITTLLLVLIAQFSLSQTINTDAPSVSAGATTVGKGIFQVESRIQYSTVKGNHNLQIPSNLFRFGIGNKFELRMTNGITSNGSFSKSSFPFTFGLKAQILNKSEGNTQIAFLLDLNRPNFKSNFYSGAGTIAVNHNLGEKNSIGYNFGFRYNSFSPPGFNFKSYSLLTSIVYSHIFTEKFSFFVEFYGNHTRNITFSMENSTVNIDGGFLYLVNDKFQIDYSYGLGISENSSFHALGFNFMIGPKAK